MTSEKQKKENKFAEFNWFLNKCFHQGNFIIELGIRYNEKFYKEKAKLFTINENLFFEVVNETGVVARELRLTTGAERGKIVRFGPNSNNDKD